jgi:hypothetical protein
LGLNFIPYSQGRKRMIALENRVSRKIFGHERRGSNRMHKGTKGGA